MIAKLWAKTTFSFLKESMKFYFSTGKPVVNIAARIKTNLAV
jgi:hypothetical protein